MAIKYKNQITASYWAIVRVFAFFVLTVLVVIVLVQTLYGQYASSFSSLQDVETNFGIDNTEFTDVSYMSDNPNTNNIPIPIVSTGASEIDLRAYVLDEYFRANNSPLYGTGKIFAAACDRYGAPRDCTTVAAIARAETDLCKYLDSASYFNCWGFGGGGIYRIRFSNWEESINLVTERLVNSYGIRYMIDPSLMEQTFCGSEPGCTGWGNRVKYFMYQISNYSKELGFTNSLFELR